MKITKEIVNTLLGLIDQGLCHGAGGFNRPGDFCVQQAVNSATTGYKTDKPACVNYSVREFGISCNDMLHVSSEERARILKKFAVAELGSADIDDRLFQKGICEKWSKKHNCWRDNYRPEHESEVEELVDMAVEVLKELKSPGTEYLYMCEPGAQLKPEHQEALKKEQELEKRLTQWKGFGTTKSCATKKTTHK